MSRLSSEQLDSSSRDILKSDEPILDFLRRAAHNSELVEPPEDVWRMIMSIIVDNCDTLEDSFDAARALDNFALVCHMFHSICSALRLRHLIFSARESKITPTCPPKGLHAFIQKVTVFSSGSHATHLPSISSVCWSFIPSFQNLSTMALVSVTVKPQALLCIASHPYIQHVAISECFINFFDESDGLQAADVPSDSFLPLPLPPPVTPWRSFIFTRNIALLSELALNTGFMPLVASPYLRVLETDDPRMAEAILQSPLMWSHCLLETLLLPHNFFFPLSRLSLSHFPFLKQIRCAPEIIGIIASGRPIEHVEVGGNHWLTLREHLQQGSQADSINVPLHCLLKASTPHLRYLSIALWHAMDFDLSLFHHLEHLNLNGTAAYGTTENIEDYKQFFCGRRTTIQPAHKTVPLVTLRSVQCTDYPNLQLSTEIPPGPCDRSWCCERVLVEQVLVFAFPNATEFRLCGWQHDGCGAWRKAGTSGECWKNWPWNWQSRYSWDT